MKSIGSEMSEEISRLEVENDQFKNRSKELEVERNALRVRVDKLEEEVEITDKLLEDRNRVLDELECSVHGQCVPGALEQIRELKKTAAVLGRTPLQDDPSIFKEQPPKDRWDRRTGFCCATCMFFSPKSDTEGRCRRRAPTMNGYPVVLAKDDWCGDHKLGTNPHKEAAKK